MIEVVLENAESVILSGGLDHAAKLPGSNSWLSSALFFSYGPRGSSL